MSKQFNHLNIPSHWQSYWTRFPEGHTILEALIQWVSQVDEMVDNQNELSDTVSNYGSRLDQFIDQFDGRLSDEVKDTLGEWQQSGFLDVVINDALDTKYHEMDDRLTAQLAQTPKKGEVTQGDLNKNTFNLDATWFASSFLDQLNNGVIETTNVLDNSLSTKKYINDSVTSKKINHRSLNLFKIEDITPNALTNGSQDNPNNDYNVSNYMPVEPNVTYKMSLNKPSSLIFRYDINYNYIGPSIPGKGSETPTDTFEFTYTDPEVRFIRTNIPKNLMDIKDYVFARKEDFEYAKNKKLEWLIVDEENLSDSLRNKSLPNRELERFNGMNLLVSGDSITEENTRATVNWHDYLKDWLGFSEIENDGKSGTGLVKSYGSNPGIIDRIDNWGDEQDMILIMGAMNDGTSGEVGDEDNVLPLGTFSDSPSKESVYGAMHLLIQKLIDKYPNNPIGFITSTPRSQVGVQGKCWGVDGWFENYNTAYKEVCAHYSIPVLDLYHNSGLRPWNADNNKKFFSYPTNLNGDGIHPNELGQELMAQKIYEFVKQYM